MDMYPNLPFKLSVVIVRTSMLTVIMLSVLNISAGMLSVSMLSAIYLSIIMLGVVILSVMAPIAYSKELCLPCNG